MSLAWARAAALRSRTATVASSVTASGQVVLTRLDGDLLQRVATAGGGRFVPLSALPQLIAALHAAGSRKMSSGVAAHVKLSSWLNDGVWLLPALLLLAALVARRGWV